MFGFFRKKRMLMPAYIREFKCSGADCEFNCCGGWVIAIDRSSFSLVSKMFKRNGLEGGILTCNKQSKLPDLYGRLNLRDCMCPLLGSDRLCCIQKECGETSLPKACATFPRVVNEIGGILQISARLSCPVVLDLLFSCENSLEIIESSIDARSFVRNNRLEIANVNWKARKKNRFVANFEEIQKFVIEVLKNREISIEERLEVLCQVIMGLTELGELTQNNLNMVEIGQGIKDLEYQHEFILGNIISEHIFAIKEFEREKFGEVILRKLEMAESLEFLDYEKGINEVYLKFRDEINQVFERFLINWVINEMFPFKSDSIYYETVRLVINFAVIRYLFVSEKQDGEAFDRKSLLEIISTYARAFGNTELPKFKQSMHANSKEVFDLLKILIRV